MAQGQLKGVSKKKNTSAASRHAQKSASTTKKGQRYIAPKKKDAVKHAALHKVSFIGFVSGIRVSDLLYCRS